MTRIAAFSALAGLFVGILAGCSPAAEPLAKAGQPDATDLLCGETGRLVGELYGGIRAGLDWDRTEVACEGMPRPDGDGARLRFAGNAPPGDRQITIIIAMPEFDPGSTNGELAANVTLIEEGTGRFYSTPDFGNCLVDISAVEPLDASGERYSVTGALYCVSPLPAMNDDSSVSIPELEFTGLLEWSGS